MSKALNLSSFSALTFDMYGTLIDWEPHILGFLQAWARRNAIQATDDELLEQFDRARAHYQQLRPALLYPDVLRASYAYICTHWRAPIDPGEQAAFADSVSTWEPFPDAAEGLSYLKQFYSIGALSNIDERSLAHSIAKLGITLDLVVTAERVGAYKPSLAHFVTAISELGGMGVGHTRLLHIGQSLRADIRPCNKLGIKTVWLNRDRRSLGLHGHGATLAVPDLTFATLEELVTAHARELEVFSSAS